MAKTEYIGKLIKYNPDTFILESKISFMTPDKHFILQDLIKESGNKIISIKGGVERSVTYKQQKGYYKLLDIIMYKLSITRTAENRTEFDDYIRKELFPTAEVQLGDEITYRPKKMKEMSDREMMLVINRLLYRYEFLGIKLEAN